MTRKLSSQQIYCGLWEKFQIPARDRVSLLSELQNNHAAWDAKERELKERCERGESNIGKGAGRKEQMQMCVFVLKHPEHSERFELELI